MTGIVTIALPFFGLMLLGYVFARRRIIPPNGSAGLKAFVAYLAMPALFFRLLDATPYAELPGWSFILVTTFAGYCAFAIAFSSGALLNRGNIPEATMEGLIGSLANIGVLGPALAVPALGAAAGAPMALVFTFDFALLAILAPLMMVLGGTERPDLRAMARAIAMAIFRQPLVIATILGVLAAWVGLRLPGPVDSLIAALAAAAAPAALFGFGLDLATRQVAGPSAGTLVAVAIKLVVHPLIVYLLLGWIGGFDGVWVDAAILLAALPPGSAVVVAARKYGIMPEQAATAIAIGTMASVVTLIVILALVQGGDLPTDPFH